MPYPTGESVGSGIDFPFASVTLRDCSPPDAARLVAEAVAARKPLAVHLCNAYTLTLAARNENYAGSLAGNSLNLVDGTPVTWYYRLLTGRRSLGPVRGPSFMRRMLEQPGLRHFLYGGTDSGLAQLTRRIAEDFPTASVVGGMAPPFRELGDADLAELVDRLRVSRADLVWVGLGTPKQDIMLQRLVNEHGFVAVGVGAAFDFLSGAKREAPRFLHGTGLEWLYRLVSEPRRLWRRYLVGNAVFLWLVARELRRQRASPPL